MGDKSNIEWTEATWNPVTGCDKVSPGCKNCYAKGMAKRLQAMGQPNYQHGFDLTLQPHMLELPRKWKRPRVIFVNSMSDLFHDEVPEDYIQQVFQVMREVDRHTYLILTKRAERLAVVGHSIDWPENVWMGVSVESQKYADRIEHLCNTKAKHKFLSLEPLLGSIDLVSNTRWFWKSNVQWVIAGGESGPNARPVHPDWVRSLRDQCESAGVPFFFKQWGEWRPPAPGEEFNTAFGNAGKPPAYLVSQFDGTVHCFYPADDLATSPIGNGSQYKPMLRIGKKRSGATLDGREYRETPFPNLKPHA